MKYPLMSWENVQLIHLLETSSHFLLLIDPVDPPVDNYWVIRSVCPIQKEVLLQPILNCLS